LPRPEVWAKTGGMPEVVTELQWRVLVTRPHSEAQSLAAALASRGVDPIVAPLIEIHYRDGAALDLADVQAVLCTSANGVRALARASRERRLPLLAVGEATAACARAEGFAAVASAGGNVGDLARLAAAQLRPRGGRLVHAGGSEVAGDLVTALRAQGFDIVREILYEVRPAAALSQEIVQALRAGEVDFALFFSPRTAALFARLVAGAGVAGRCGAIAALSISAAADIELAGLAWRERCVADRPTQAALLDELDRLLIARRQGCAARLTDRKEPG
jgi:uroporphyrinogen-III synthase